MKIKPVSDYVLIEPIYHTKTSRGIFIPEELAKENFREGKVIEIGIGRIDEETKERIPMEIKIGDTVLLGIGGYDVEIDDKEYYMVREKHIKVILNKKNDKR